jgi:hypothetical protein
MEHSNASADTLNCNHIASVRPACAQDDTRRVNEVSCMSEKGRLTPGHERPRQHVHQTAVAAPTAVAVDVVVICFLGGLNFVIVRDAVGVTPQLLTTTNATNKLFSTDKLIASVRFLTCS